MILTDLRNRAKSILSSITSKSDCIETELLSKSHSDAEYLENLYQVSYDIENGLEIDGILSRLKTDKIRWRNPFFNKAACDESEQDNFIEHPFEVHEGALECLKCHSKRVFSFQKQTRGADEPATTFAQCVQCNNKWTYSG